MALPPVKNSGHTASMASPAGRPAPLKRRKSQGREWADAIVFAVIAATLIRTLFIEAYVIPSGSMERSLMIGDYLFVSKVNYGARMPLTPIAFPFAHNTMPLIGVKSYWDGLQLPYYRLPGFQPIKRYDVVVFNWPGDTVNNRPADKKENYIKRLQGLPGDTVQLIDAQAYVNGKALEIPAQGQLTYRVKTDGTEFNLKVMDDLGITGADSPASDGTYLLFMTPSSHEKILHFTHVRSVVPANIPDGQFEVTPLIFPGDTLHKWNMDFYGPLVVPKKGMVMKLDAANIAIYARAIRSYEKNLLEIKADGIYINHFKTSSYTFKMNYYWMLGDNRHNSIDSRYWGFVPEDHIVGKALFVWWSWDEHASFISKVRWNRIFMGIR